MTIQRAMETATRYLLANEVYSPAMDDWQMEVERVEKTLPSGCPICGDMMCSSQMPSPVDWAPCPQSK